MENVYVEIRNIKSDYIFRVACGIKNKFNGEVYKTGPKDFAFRVASEGFSLEELEESLGFLKRFEMSVGGSGEVPVVTVDCAKLNSDQPFCKPFCCPPSPNFRY